MRLLLCCLCCLLAGVVFAGEPPLIPLAAGERLVEMRSADVTGDGILDHLALIDWKEEPEFPGYSQKLRLVDGASGTESVMTLFGQGGYGSKIMLPRLNGDAVPEILVEIDNGGSLGSSTYPLLTAVGGTLRELLPTDWIDIAPKASGLLLPNYRARIELPEYHRATIVNLQLAMPNKKEREKTYAGVYAPDGRLLRTEDAYSTPYSWMEPVNLDGSDDDELVGYQSVRAVCNANGIALVRTVLDWQGTALVVKDVRVIPYLAPERYQQTLNTLPKTADGVRQAIGLFRNAYPDAPAAWRDEAFRAFLSFQQDVMFRENERFTGGDDAVKRYNAIAANRDAGFVAYTTEMDPVIEVRQGFAADTFGAWMTPAVREYLRLEKAGYTGSISAEGMLLISLEELGKQVHAWEAYLGQYPDSPFVPEALTEYRYQLAVFLFGDDGATHFDIENRRLLPAAKTTLQQYAARYPDMLSARQVTAVLALYARYKNTWSVALGDAVRQYQERHDEERAGTYFPTDLAATWTYAVIGATPSSCRLTAAYAKDGKVQFNRTAETPGYLIFDVQADKVAQLSSALKAGVTENRLADPNSMYQVQLLGPIRKGHVWTSNGLRHEILHTGLALPVFGRVYLDVIEVAHTAPNDTETGTREYYAVGIGLVRRDYSENGSIVGQELLWEYKAETE